MELVEEDKKHPEGARGTYLAKGSPLKLLLGKHFESKKEERVG